ncbi:trimeric intracellular cation channel family protein [Rhodovibrionaceae bacterium A322]
MSLLELLRYLDLLGVAVFALSGALAAGRARLDVFGFAVVATITGVGGGTLRDLVLGSTPVFWVTDPAFIWICLVASVLAYFAMPKVASRYTLLLWMDAGGLALFAVGGAEKALLLGVSPLIAVMMGVMTAVFGGVIRDILCGEVPLVLRREIYATVAFVGAALFVGLEMSQLAPGFSALIAMACAFVLRILAIQLGWSLPPFDDRKAGAASGVERRKKD